MRNTFTNNQNSKSSYFVPIHMSTKPQKMTQNNAKCGQICKSVDVLG